MMQLKLYLTNIIPFIMHSNLILSLIHFTNESKLAKMYKGPQNKFGLPHST